MSVSRHVDVAILGAGTAGLAAQNEVSRYTDNYVVIDPGPLGTLCARTACMPSKVLIEIANTFRHVAQAPADLRLSIPDQINSEAIMRRVRDMRDDFVKGVLDDMKQWHSHLVQKHARFVDMHTLDLDGELLTADKIIIAVGGQPVVPSEWDAFSTHLLTTDSFFELQRLPSSLGVIGLGPAGIELAQALTYLGVDVHGFDPTTHIGGLTDPVIREHATSYFGSILNLHIVKAGITGQHKNGVTIAAEDLAAEDLAVRVEKALVVMGRQPALDALDFEALGLGKDVPEVDPDTMQIGSLPLYLAGDVNTRRAVQHEAAAEGRIAGFHATHSTPRNDQRWPKLAITFTTPNIAVVGRSFEELTNEEVEFTIGGASFAKLGRARMLDGDPGLLRVYVRPHDGLLLGAELIVPQGEHLAHQLAWAIAWNKTVYELLSLPFYHPTLEEGLRQAFIDAARKLRRT